MRKLSSYIFAPLATFNFFRYVWAIMGGMLRGEHTNSSYTDVRHRLVDKTFKKVGLDVEVIDPKGLLDADKSRIYVLNHESFIDAIILLGSYSGDIRFMAKSSLFSVPLLGHAMRFERHIPVYRGKSRSKNKGLIDRLEEVFQEGGSVFFFPEGTRSTDGKLGVFKLGAFIASVRYKVPMVVIRLEGTGKALRKGEFVLDVDVPCKVRVLEELEAFEVLEGESEGEAAERMSQRAREVLEGK